jgi:hypothetical protein
VKVEWCDQTCKYDAEEHEVDTFSPNLVDSLVNGLAYLDAIFIMLSFSAFLTDVLLKIYRLASERKRVSPVTKTILYFVETVIVFVILDKIQSTVIMLIITYPLWALAFTAAGFEFFVLWSVLAFPKAFPKTKKGRKWDTRWSVVMLLMIVALLLLVIAQHFEPTS